MNNERRQQILAIIAPTLVVLAIYNWFFYRDISNKLSEKKKEYSSLSQSSPSPVMLMKAQRDLASIQKENTKLRDLLEKAQESMVELSHHVEGPDNYTQAVKDVGKLLDKYKLHVVQESRVENTQAQAISPGLSMVCDELSKHQEASQRKVKHLIWQYEIVGSYSNVQHVLENWKQEEDKVSAMPVGLKMLPADPYHHDRRWILFVRF